MSGMPKRRHPLSTLSNTTRQALKRSASAMGKQKILPKALTKAAQPTGPNQAPKPSQQQAQKDNA